MANVANAFAFQGKNGELWFDGGSAIGCTGTFLLEGGNVEQARASFRRVSLDIARQTGRG